MDRSNAGTCPYCGELLEVYVDPGAGERQTFIEDCAVCCRPVRFTVSYSTENNDYEIEAVAEDR